MSCEPLADSWFVPSKIVPPLAGAEGREGAVGVGTAPVGVQVGGLPSSRAEHADAMLVPKILPPMASRVVE